MDISISNLFLHYTSPGNQKSIVAHFASPSCGKESLWNTVPKLGRGVLGKT